jgi:hypothetical protein
VDQNRLIAEVMQRTGIRLSPDDPAFVIVELNRLAFEDLIERAGERLDPLAERIDKAARLAATEVTRSTLRSISEDTREARALIASEAREAASRAIAEADTARKSAAVAIERMANAHKLEARWKMVVVGLVVALVIAMCSFAAGYALGVSNTPLLLGTQLHTT